MSDQVALRGISGFGYHGVLPDERRDGQQFLVDVSCCLDLAAAADTDDLHRTLDYSELARSVVADIEGEPVRLIETLAARIASTCLHLRDVDSVEVTVHKPQAPMPVPVGDVAVTISRSRRSDKEQDG